MNLPGAPSRVPKLGMTGSAINRLIEGAEGRYSKAEAKAEAKVEVKVEAEVEAEVEAKAEAKVEAKAEVEIKVEVEVEVEVESAPQITQIYQLPMINDQ
jgi:RecB family exonuclease